MTTKWYFDYNVNNNTKYAAVTSVNSWTQTDVENWCTKEYFHLLASSGVYDIEVDLNTGELNIDNLVVYNESTWIDLQREEPNIQLFAILHKINNTLVFP